MNVLTVGMGDLQVTSDPDRVLVTYALGSCIALVVHDPIRFVGGMIHFQLPLSSVSPEKAQLRPGMFADTGVPMLFHKMYALSARKPDMIVKIIGGAKICDTEDTFEIGKRNYVTLRKMLWKAGVGVAAEDVGGTASRTVRLFVNDGRTSIKTADGQETQL